MSKKSRGVWQALSDETKDHYLNQRIGGVDVVVLAEQLGIKPASLDRYLRQHRADRGLPPMRQRRDGKPAERKLPEYHELFEILRKGKSMSVGQLSAKLDRSEATIVELLDAMEADGYVLERTRGHVMPATTVPQMKPVITAPVMEEGEEIRFAVASDLQVGSAYCQPSALNHFIGLAVEQYGVRHIFIPGDVTTGVYGYRGHEQDMVPSCRPLSRIMAHQATRAQVELADYYIPQIPGVQYYAIGGNHDAWHVTKAGLDPIALLAQRRPDIHHLGWDAADVPLTENIGLRMWHPSGGVPYALSYRTQKALEQVAFEQLNVLIDEGVPPKVRFLLAGHLHIECKFQRGPLTASQCGCFEGQTNYLKRKGYYPSIGGQIWQVWATGAGQIRRVTYTFEPYPEIPNDWKNWPAPEQPEVRAEGEQVQTLFRLAGVESWDDAS